MYQQGAGEMADWLSIVATSSEDVGSIPITHMVVHNHL